LSAIPYTPQAVEVVDRLPFFSFLVFFFWFTDFNLCCSAAYLDDLRISSNSASNPHLPFSLVGSTETPVAKSSGLPENTRDVLNTDMLARHGKGQDVRRHTNSGGTYRPWLSPSISIVQISKSTMFKNSEHKKLCLL
jgi:hypothetical protein